jgi:hypothetical protein
MTALTVYVFFATWCVPCRQELPALAALSERYVGQPVEFVLVAVDASSSRDEVPRFLARTGAKGRLVYDDDSRLLERYDPSGSVPFIAVVDEGGALVYVHRGYEPGDELELGAALDRALLRRREGELVVTMSSSTIGIWRRDDFVAGEPTAARLLGQRLDLDTRHGPWRGTLRLDGAWVDASESDLDARPERFALRWERSGVRLGAGDGYAVLGHGLTLSVRKLDPLGTDTSIQGAHVELDRGGVRARLHAGRLNPQNLDAATYRTFADPSDLAAGVGVEERVSDGVTLNQAIAGFHLGAAAPDGGDVDVGLTAAGVAVARGPWQSRAEVGVLAESSLGTRTVGYGGFVSNTLVVGAVALTAEAKLYRRFAVGRVTPVVLTFHEPPTLERNDQEVPGNRDAAGGRLAASLGVGSRSLTVSALAYRFSLDDEPAWQGGRAAHVYATFEQRPAPRAAWALSVGGRDEREPDGTLGLRFVQLAADVATPLVGRVGLSGKWDHRFEEKTVFGGPIAFVRGTGVASLAWGGVASVSAIYGYSTEAEARPTHYPAAELRVRLGDVGEVRLLGGRLVGGRICVSGSCRDVPPFEGVRAELLIQNAW